MVFILDIAQEISQCYHCFSVEVCEKELWRAKDLPVTWVQLFLLRLTPSPHQRFVLLTSETGVNATGITFFSHAGKATTVEFVTLLLKVQSFG